MEKLTFKNTAVFKSFLMSLVVYSAVLTGSFIAFFGANKLFLNNEEEIQQFESSISSTNAKINDLSNLKQQEKNNSDVMKNLDKSKLIVYDFNFEDLFLIKNFLKSKEIEAAVKQEQEEDTGVSHDQKNIKKKTVTVSYFVNKNDERSCLDEFYDLDKALPGYLHIDSFESILFEANVKCNLILKWTFLFLN